MNDFFPQELCSPKQAKDKKIWRVSGSSARSLLIAQQAKAHKGPVIVVTAQNDTATSFLQTLPFFYKDNPVIEFPDWETLPYDSFSPNPSIVSSRLKSLLKISSGSSGIIIVSMPTLLHKMVPPEHLLSRSFSIKKNQPLARDSLREQLILAGYHKVSNVSEPGDFSIRGSLIDFFPMAKDQPVRVDFFGDEIDEIRYFDSITQRSTEAIDLLELMPASEVPQEEDKKNSFLSRWNSMFPGDSRQSSIFCDVKAGLLPAGIEYYLPLYFEEMSSFFDYLPKNALVIVEEGLTQSAENYWVEVEERYSNLSHQVYKPILAPQQLFFRSEEIMSELSEQRVIELTGKKTKKVQSELQQKELPELLIKTRQNPPLADLAGFCQATKDPVLLCCDGKGRTEIISDLLRDAHLDHQVIDNWQDFTQNKKGLFVCSAPLIDGLWLEDRFVLITEHSLYGEQPTRQITKEQQPNSEFLFRSLVELNLNCPVVHFSHGIGIYRGLEMLQLDGYQQEFVVLEYYSGDKLYVPVTDLHLISRYQGTDLEKLVLDKMGSDQWSKKKAKAEKKAKDSAIELLEVQARRESKKGISIKPVDEDYHSFVAQFPYVETSDQSKAIEQVLEDMRSSKVMDRLVCGDVGFGKTEVAMRAAFLAVQNGRQVAVLAPTTLLTQQHFDSFRDRFSSWPVKIEMISRFRSKKETEEIWQSIEQGKVDIVIGTHALLSDSKRLKDVGLLIIDEEHRFGVRQKEQLKKVRAEVDILTLTATPIPRTLNFSLSGLRDLSIIATAPSNRLSIKTFVHNDKDHIVREAIVRELMRGGQVFVLHNQVKTIEARRQKLQELVPEARIGIAHGQMPKRDLEKTMAHFYHRQFNLLLCTTIIETGIDIPSANTIIIERADKFGLAQLHQLRGRVGRSYHQAYAYLMVPEYLTSEAKKRLDAISSTATLGAGFTLAMHDMEIRGAGELLGDSQSGEIEKVGFTMYLSMLEQAVQSIRSGGLPKETQHEIKLDLSVSALIPEEYLPDVHNRLVLYRRIVNTSNKTDLTKLRIETIDRFGSIPEELNNLFLITALRQQAQKLHIESIRFSDAGGYIVFRKTTPVNPADIIRLVQQEPQTYAIVAGDKLKVSRKTKTVKERIEVIESIISIISVGLAQKKPTSVPV